MIQIQVLAKGTLRGMLNKVKSRLADGLERGLEEAGRVLLRESLDQVPRDTEVLANDGHIRMEGSGLDSVAVVGYGTEGVVAAQDRNGKLRYRDPSKYAHWLHEGIFPSWAQPAVIHNGKKIKFLEDPSKDPIVQEEMAEVIRRELPK